LEVNYHELGGLYDQLADAGKVKGVVIGPAEVDRATREAPPGGRSAVRGQCVKEFRGEGWVCDWRYIYHTGNRTFVDLRNPVETARRTIQVESLPDDDAPDMELHELFARLFPVA